MNRGYGFRLGLEQSLRALALVSLLVAVATPVSAIENIRSVMWDQANRIEWSPGVSKTSLVFDGNLTALEAAYGVTSFSIAVQRAVGSPDILARYSCGPLLAGVPAGTPARFEIEFWMSCDPFNGRIDIRQRPAIMSYLHPIFGKVQQVITVEALRSTASARESFGLAIVDMDGVVSPASLPVDSFACITTADNGSIGVYFDPQGNTCQGTIPGGTTSKVYVLAKPAGGTAGGIAGAQFRFTGTPSAWEVYAVPSPDIVAIGDPFGDGVVTGFICKPPADGVVLLYTVIVIAHETINDVRFEIGERVPTLTAPCPMLLACDDPVFTKFCVDGLSCYVNATANTPCTKIVAVNAATWSTVKGLYR